MYRPKLQEKFREAAGAVLPIAAIVLLLAVSIAPVPSGILLSFLLGGFLLIVGMMLFSLGAELAMTPMGERMGSGLTKTKNLPLILVTSFAMGLLITVSEPDLQVLAGQVQAIPNAVLILSVGVGVGLFLLTAVLRMLLGISLKRLLLGLYALVFLLTLVVPKDFLTVAFDAGGVTTGPMTVPFIMAFGVGAAGIRNDRRAEDDSMGLVALCSVGPILCVLLLSLIYRPDSSSFVPVEVPDVSESVALGRMYLAALPSCLGEIAGSLLPVILFFGLYQLLLLRLDKRSLKKIGVGLLYTYAGLTLFLTGANVGFMPAGFYLGRILAGGRLPQIIIPIGMLMGYFIVKAEPAVYVLMKQVEELTSGAVSGRMLQISLSLGVSVSVGLAMLRVLTGIPVLAILLPGYGLALLLSFFVPDIFTAIAFDSGGVASGPMTATFLLPLAMGACSALGGNVITDAFGVVSLVAMTPLAAIQLLGLFSRLRSRRRQTLPERAADPYAELDDYAVIEL